MTKATKVGVYVRISRDDAAKTGKGVARQEKDAIALADGRGWLVAEVYRDNDVSAFSGKVRPEYERLLADLSTGAIDGIVAWHPDRLHRSPRELERFIDVVEDRKAIVATVQAGELDLSTASGRMTARVVEAVARHESEHKAERQRRKARELAEAGKLAGGGTRPFGFNHDRMTLNEGEAEVIRDLARRVLAGETLRGIASWLTASGVPTVGGGAWTTPLLRRLLVSARIAGLREHHGEVVAVAEWPAIVDRPTHEALRRVLLDPARKARRPARSYLLTGLAYCSLCGAKLVARPRGDGRRAQVCAKGPNFSGCGKIRSLTEPPFDEQLPGAIRHNLQMAYAAFEDLFDLTAALHSPGANRFTTSLSRWLRPDLLEHAYPHGAIVSSLAVGYMAGAQPGIWTPKEVRAAARPLTIVASEDSANASSRRHHPSGARTAPPAA